MRLCESLVCLVAGIVFSTHVPPLSAQGSQSKQPSAPSQAAATKARPSLVGKWQSPDSVVQINADGTLTVNGTVYRYTAQGSTFTLIGFDGAVTMPFELDGDRLALTINGQVVPVKRNHPKTNDPMLCLDGRCFVTDGPKPPWR